MVLRMHSQSPPAERLGVDDDAVEWVITCEGVGNHLRTQLVRLHEHASSLGSSSHGLSLAQQNDLAAMTAAIERMLGVLESTLWHPETRPTPHLTLERVDLAALLGQLTRDILVIVGSDTELGQARRDVRVVAEAAHNLPTIMADVLQLRRVFENLLVNALLHAGTDTIRLNAHQDQSDHVVIHLDDGGVGMREGGSEAGLGLGICHRLVQAHGGSMQTQSQQKVGTRVTVRLPISGPLAADSASQTDAASPSCQPTWIDRAHAISEAGHDLRAPLNTVIGFAQLMLQQLDDPLDTRRRTTLEQIDQHARSVLHVANQLLEAARLATNRIRLATSSVQANDLMQRVASALRATEEIASHVEVDVLPADSVVLGDDERLRDALVFLAADSLADLEFGRLLLRVRMTTHPPKRGASFAEAVETTRIEIVARGQPRNRSQNVGPTARRTTETLQTDNFRRRLGVLLARGYVTCHGGLIEYSPTPDRRVWVVTLCSRGDATQRS